MRASNKECFYLRKKGALGYNTNEMWLPGTAPFWWLAVYSWVHGVASEHGRRERGTRTAWGHGAGLLKPVNLWDNIHYHDRKH